MRIRLIEHVPDFGDSLSAVLLLPGWLPPKKRYLFHYVLKKVPVKTQRFQFLTHFLKTGDQFLYSMPAGREMKLTSGMA
jgi:hypothetical protein